MPFPELKLPMLLCMEKLTTISHYVICKLTDGRRHLLGIN